MNPKVPLPPCTNVTYIRASYSRGPESESYGGWDQQFWDRQYMPERELADLNRNGKRCMSPCSQIYYNVEASYLPKDQLIVSSNKVHLKTHFISYLGLLNMNMDTKKTGFMLLHFFTRLFCKRRGKQSQKVWVCIFDSFAGRST